MSATGKPNNRSKRNACGSVCSLTVCDGCLKVESDYTTMGNKISAYVVSLPNLCGNAKGDDNVDVSKAI